MRAQVFTDGQAEDRLAELGLSGEDCDFALRGADAEARVWTLMAPPIMRGMARWGKTNELLRARLIPKGWSYDNPRNLPRTLSPARDVALVATTGDAATGHADRTPTTGYAKGVETIRAIERNGQLALDYALAPQVGEALAEVADSDEGLLTWLLLYHVTADQIHAEVSLPESISPRGYVDSWVRRILLPVIELEDVAVDHNDARERAEDGYAVAVERR